MLKDDWVKTNLASTGSLLGELEGRLGTVGEEETSEVEELGLVDEGLDLGGGEVLGGEGLGGSEGGGERSEGALYTDVKRRSASESMVDSIDVK